MRRLRAVLGLAADPTAGAARPRRLTGTRIAPPTSRGRPSVCPPGRSVGFRAYRLLREERQMVSVANLTCRDAIEFLDLAPKSGVETTTTIYPLERPNDALANLRAGRFQGAACWSPEWRAGQPQATE